MLKHLKAFKPYDTSNSAFLNTLYHYFHISYDFI